MTAAFVFLVVALIPGIALALQLDLAAAEGRRTGRHRKSSCSDRRRRARSQEIVL